MLSFERNQNAPQIPLRETLCTLRGLKPECKCSSTKLHLVAVQLPSQIPCAPHKFLVLMLLHLQLPLSLHADGYHLVLFGPLDLITFLSDLHSFEKLGGYGRRVFGDEIRGVGRVCDLSIRVCRLLDCQDGGVCPVLGLEDLRSFSSCSKRLGCIHRRGSWRWVERQISVGKHMTFKIHG